MNRQIYRILSGRCGARLEIQILMRRTARAFGVKAPGSMGGRSAPELLRTYAQFTAGTARHAIDSGEDLEQLQRRLYEMAFRLGSLLRRWLRPEGERECLAVIALLYRNIGIRVGEEAPGEFTFYRCYFSAFYTPDLCAVISAIDQGIFAGIYRRRRLTFRERITEGCGTCRAYLSERKQNDEKSDRDRFGRRRRHDGQRTAGTFSGNDSRGG